VLTLFQRNVLVDSNGVARLGGLGSAFALSLPASRSDVDDGRLFCGIAPELINPHTFGLVHARTTKDTDMFAFSMLAWEVSRILRSFDLECSSALVGPRSSPGSPHSLEGSRRRSSSRCSMTTDRCGLFTVKSRIPCGR